MKGFRKIGLLVLGMMAGVLLPALATGAVYAGEGAGYEEGAGYGNEDSVTVGKGTFCRIGYQADRTDTVVLKGEMLRLEQTGEDRSGDAGAFSLQFFQPGVYRYEISNGDASYQIEVQVQYETEGLAAMPVVYRSEKEKAAAVDFRGGQKEEKTDVRPANGQSGKRVAAGQIVRTGDEQKTELWLMLLGAGFATMIIAGAFIWEVRKEYKVR